MIPPGLSVPPEDVFGATLPSEGLRSRRLSVIVAAMLLAAVGVGSPAQAQPARPNIVFILADDLGIGDTGVTNQNARAAAGLPSFATPNIDSIAQAGVRFNNMYTGASNCSPSRNVLLTGFNQMHTIFEQANLYTDIRPGEQDKTWGQVMQQAGYSTGMFGKWHLGGVNPSSTAIRTPSAMPTQKGFDVAYGPMEGDFRMAFHWQSDGAGGMQKVATPAEPTWTGSGSKNVFGDTLVTNHATDFIRQKAGGSQPFLAYVPLMAPHIPVNQVPQDHPYTLANRPDLNWTQVHRDYAGMMWYLDQNVGKILGAINDPNNDGNNADSVANNTIVIFASDNGPLPTGPSGFSTEFFNSNISYYGAKGITTDGGIRTPMFVRWTGTIAPGTQNNAVATFADVMPTFAGLAGQDVPLGIDGRSMLSDILGGPASERPDVVDWAMTRELGADNPAGWTVRVGDWKLTKRNPTSIYPTVTYKLNNIALDPGELVNRATSGPNQRLDILNALEAIGAAEGWDREPYGPSPDNASIQERIPTYFAQYKTWAPQAGSANFYAAANWAGGTQFDKPGSPEANNWNTGPADNWLATMANTTATAQQITLNSDASVLAVELRGTAATMALRVNSGVRFTARNGLRISSGGILRLRGGEINTIRELEIRVGGRFDGEGTVNGQQAAIAGIPEFAGKGLFEPKVINGGIFAVASDGDASFDAGLLTIQGDYQQLSSGVMQMDVFSTGGVAGLNYDQLAVTGKASLAGVLAIAAVNPTSLTLGNSFQIITANGGLSGAFTSVLGPALSPGLGWAVQYSSTGALLKVVQVAGSGGPLGYLAQWRQSFGVDAGADIDGDGDTDGNDFLLWQRGAATTPAVAAGASAVPEPAACLVLLTALAAVSPWRRRAAA